LVAGAAFGADISASVSSKVNLVKGSSQEGKGELQAGGNMVGVSLGASGQNEEGTLGGSLTFRVNGVAIADGPRSVEPWVTLKTATVWWKPVSMLRVLLGGNKDGMFGADGGARWQFYQAASDFVASEAWAFSSAYYGGWADAGAVITLTPMDGLSINVAVPFISRKTGWGTYDSGDRFAADYYRNMAAQVSYNIDGVGRVALTYQGNYSEGGFTADDSNPLDVKFNGGEKGTLLAFFGLTAVENLSFDVGLGIPFIEKWKDVGGSGKDATLFKMSAGFTLGYKFGAFGVKSRFLFDEFGAFTYDKESVPNKLKLRFDIMPYYTVNEKVTINISGGMNLVGPQMDEDWKKVDVTGNDAVVAWHVNPYLTVNAGGGAFYAGVDIRSAGGNDPFITWAVPIGISFGF